MSTSHRYKLTLAYDGTRYFGWQVQPGKPTIQAELERVIRKLTGEKTRVHSSGRTDTGVHARAQVAHFDIGKSLDPRRVLLGMNALLEADIRVDAIRPVASDFHARLSATGKEYRYFIWNGPIMPPQLRLYRTHMRNRLNESAMSDAASRLVGRHDFVAFSANQKREIDGTVRRLFSLEVRRRGQEILIVARGEGFLYKMVRSLAGFLIRVGADELPPSQATTILRSKTRTARVPTAHPQGLFLWKVTYDPRDLVSRVNEVG